MGGGQTKTVTQSSQSAPQIVPEAREGFLQAQDFYKGVLGDTPVYGGQRLFGPTGTQQAAIAQAGQAATGPNYLGAAGTQQLYDTMSGRYMGGPEMQAAIASGAQPLFQQLNNEIMPGIRDRATFAGQGPAGGRRQVAEDQAMQSFGNALATGVVAPLYAQERQNQLSAVGQIPGITQNDYLRYQLGREAGGQEQQFGQQQLDVEKGKFEEPLFRKSQAAEALFGASGLGGGFGLQETKGGGGGDAFGDVMSGLSTAALVGKAVFG